MSTRPVSWWPAAASVAGGTVVKALNAHVGAVDDRPFQYATRPPSRLRESDGRREAAVDVGHELRGDSSDPGSAAPDWRSRHQRPELIKRANGGSDDPLANERVVVRST